MNLTLVIFVILFVIIVLHIILDPLFLFLCKKYKITFPKKLQVPIHECGHLLAAWNCNIVCSVNGVSVTETGGATSFSYYDMKPHDIAFEEYLWCDIVISLSGIAAESLYFGKCRSGNVISDLRVARKITNRILNSNNRFVNYRRPSSGFFMKDAYYPPLSYEEDKIISDAYEQAKIIVKEMKPFIDKIANELAEKNQLSYKELDKLLPSRKFFMLGKPIIPKFYILNKTIQM